MKIGWLELALFTAGGALAVSGTAMILGLNPGVLLGGVGLSLIAAGVLVHQLKQEREPNPDPVEGQGSGSEDAPSAEGDVSG